MYHSESPAGALPETKDPRSADVPLASVAAAVMRQRRLVVLVALACAVVVAGVTLYRARTYTASAAFMPQSRGGAAGMAGLAAQLGVALPTTEAGQSPQFYADLVRSREIIGRVVDTAYTIRDGDSARVVRPLDLYSDADDPAPRRRADAILEVRDMIRTSTSTRTSVVSVDVSAESPYLAHAMVAHILRLLNEFNLEKRQTQASAERRFADRRLDEVRRDLRLAEDRLQAFLQRNREYGAPSLQFEQDRLAREVSRQSQLFTSVAQAREQAWLEEVRDTPVLTIIESPEVPAVPDSRGLLQKTLLAFLVGGAVGALIALVRASIARARLVAAGSPAIASAGDAVPASSPLPPQPRLRTPDAAAR